MDICGCGIAWLYMKYLTPLLKERFNQSIKVNNPFPNITKETEPKSIVNKPIKEYYKSDNAQNENGYLKPCGQQQECYHRNNNNKYNSPDIIPFMASTWSHSISFVGNIIKRLFHHVNHM